MLVTVGVVVVWVDWLGSDSVDVYEVGKELAFSVA